MVFIDSSKKIELFKTSTLVPISWSNHQDIRNDHFLADWEVPRTIRVQDDLELILRWRHTSQASIISRPPGEGRHDGELYSQFAINRPGDILKRFPFKFDLAPSFRRANYFCDHDVDSGLNLVVETKVDLVESGAEVSWIFSRGRLTCKGGRGRRWENQKKIFRFDQN